MDLEAFIKWCTKNFILIEQLDTLEIRLQLPRGIEFPIVVANTIDLAMKMADERLSSNNEFKNLFNSNNRLKYLFKNKHYIEQNNKKIYENKIKLDSYYNTAEVMRNNNMIDEAIYYYKKCIEVDGKFIKPYFNLGKIYYKLAQHQQAIEAFNKVLALDSKNAEAYYFLGVINGKNNFKRQEIEFYKKAIEINPNFKEAKYNLSLQLEAMKEQESIEQAILFEQRTALLLSNYKDHIKTKKDFWKSLTPRIFEEEIAKLYGSFGFGYKLSASGGGDGGVDITLTRNNKLVIIQCKAYEKNTIGQPVVRDLFGTMVHFNANVGIVATLSKFTKQAREFVKNKPIILIDLEDIIKMQMYLIKLVKPQHNDGKYVYCVKCFRINEIENRNCLFCKFTTI